MIPTTAAELYQLLGFMMLKSPTFEDALFPGRNVDSIFLELNEGLNAARAELGEEPFNALRAMSHQMRAHFKADPDDANGRTQEGRKLIQEMEAIVLSAIKSPSYPPLDRKGMIELANQLRAEEGTPDELDIVSDRLLVALPHADIMGLLFDDTRLEVEAAIDEALRREKEATGSTPE